MGEIVRISEVLERQGSCRPRPRSCETPAATPSRSWPSPASARETCPVCQGGNWLWDQRLKTMIPCEDCGAVMAIRRENLAMTSGWSEILSSMTFANLRGLSDPRANALLAEAIKAAHAYAGNPSGWLVFAGTWGDGKTHMLAAIANAQPPRSVWLYCIARDLWAWLGCIANPDEETDYEARMELVKGVDLLLMDELGAERPSEAVRERRQRLLDHRYRGGRPTVFATNAWPLERLYANQGEGWEDGWLISRLQDRRMCQVYKMPDLDYRRSG